MSDIGTHIHAINLAVTEIIDAIGKRAQHAAPDSQATTELLVRAAAVRMSELRTLLLVASGGGMELPKTLRPLQAALDSAVLGVQQEIGVAAVTAECDTSAMVVTLEHAGRSLDQARIAGLHMLGHLGAAVTRLEQLNYPRFYVVGSQSTNS